MRHRTPAADEHTFSEGIRFVRNAARLATDVEREDTYVRELDTALRKAIEAGLDFTEPPRRSPTGRPETPGLRLAELAHKSFNYTCDPFAPSYYTLACLRGSNYAQLWEAHFRTEPYFAPLSTLPVEACRQARSALECIRQERRIAQGMGIVLSLHPHPLNDSFANNPVVKRYGENLWWCAGIFNPGRDNEQVRLVYYASGLPMEICDDTMELSRSQWDTLMQEERRATETHTARNDP